MKSQDTSVVNTVNTMGICTTMYELYIMCDCASGGMMIMLPRFAVDCGDARPNVKSASPGKTDTCETLGDSGGRDGIDNFSHVMHAILSGGIGDDTPIGGAQRPFAKRHIH